MLRIFLKKYKLDQVHLACRTHLWNPGSSVPVMMTKVTKVSKVSKVSKVTKVSKVSKKSKVSEVSKVSKVSKVFKVSKVSKAGSDIPEVQYNDVLLGPALFWSKCIVYVLYMTFQIHLIIYWIPP